MQYLGLALYAEGATDYYFLRPLLQRLCEDICAREAGEVVEVSEILSLDHPESINGFSRADRILAAATLARGAWKILFLHADGANDAKRALQEQIAPGLQLLHDSVDVNGIGVAVVPVRETESWAIADGDAIRDAFGTSLTNKELGLPLTTRAAEKVTDPKAVLQAALAATQPAGRRRKRGTSQYLSALGERASLDCLRGLPAFGALENDLRAALQRLNIIRP